MLHMQQNYSMREADKTSRKYISESKKMSLSEKTRSDNPSSHSTKDHREDPFSAITGRGMKSLGRKYVQENCFKIKEKEHHEIVISDEVVRNSKLYRMLRQKIDTMDSIFLKQSKQLTETRNQLACQTSSIRNSNHTSKLQLWELKNQILQLKGILNDQEEQTKRLQIQLHNNQQYEEQEEEAQNQMLQQAQEAEKPFLSEEAEFEGNKELVLEGEEQIMKQEEMDIRMMMKQLHKKMRVNPEIQKEEQEEPSLQKEF